VTDPVQADWDALARVERAEVERLAAHGRRELEAALAWRHLGRGRRLLETLRGRRPRPRPKAHERERLYVSRWGTWVWECPHWDGRTVQVVARPPRTGEEARWGFLAADVDRDGAGQLLPAVRGGPRTLAEMAAAHGLPAPRPRRGGADGHDKDRCRRAGRSAGARRAEVQDGRLRPSPGGEEPRCGKS
jgi:hypothetical protein